MATTLREEIDAAIVDTDGETLTASRADCASLIESVQRLTEHCTDYLDARSYTDDERAQLLADLEIDDIMKSIGEALRAYSFSSFERRGQATPPDRKVAERLQDFAVAYVLAPAVGGEVLEEIESAEQAGMAHVGRVAEWTRLYSEMVLCRMVLGLPEADKAAVNREQKNRAAKPRPTRFKREAVRLRGEGLSAKEVLEELIKMKIVRGKHADKMQWLDDRSDKWNTTTYSALEAKIRGYRQA